MVEPDHIMQVTLHVVSDNEEFIEGVNVLRNQDFLYTNNLQVKWNAEAKYILMLAKTSEYFEFSHSSVGISFVIKDFFDLFDGKKLIRLFLEARFVNSWSGTTPN